MNYDEILNELQVSTLQFNAVPGHFIFSKDTMYAICNRNIILISRSVYAVRFTSQLTLILEEKYDNDTKLYTIKIHKENT